MGTYDEDVKLKYDNATLDRYLPQNNPVMKSILDTFNVKSDVSDYAKKQMDSSKDM